jgi:hypothetical protein
VFGAWLDDIVASSQNCGRAGRLLGASLHVDADERLLHQSAHAVAGVMGAGNGTRDIVKDCLSISFASGGLLNLIPPPRAAQLSASLLAKQWPDGSYHRKFSPTFCTLNSTWPLARASAYGI